MPILKNVEKHEIVGSDRTESRQTLSFCQGSRSRYVEEQAFQADVYFFAPLCLLTTLTQQRSHTQRRHVREPEIVER